MVLVVGGAAQVGGPCEVHGPAKDGAGGGGGDTQEPFIMTEDASSLPPSTSFCWASVKEPKTSLSKLNFFFIYL
jgi:hypothetical protein